MIVIKKYLSKGERDYLGNSFKQNRYVVLENGFDAIGEHLTLKQALKAKKDLQDESKQTN